MVFMLMKKGIVAFRNQIRHLCVHGVLHGCVHGGVYGIVHGGLRGGLHVDAWGSWVY